MALKFKNSIALAWVLAHKGSIAEKQRLHSYAPKPFFKA